MSRAIKATFPAEDQILKPSNSIVQWTDAKHAPDTNTNRKSPRQYVPITCGKCKKQRDAQVRSGLSNSKELTLADLNLAGKGECAGYCSDCRQKFFRKDLRLPDGAQVLFSEWDETGLPAVCGQCHASQLLDSHTAGADLSERDWPCVNCSHTLGMEERTVETEDGPISIKVFWLDRRAAGTPRGRASSRDKVGFVCRVCHERHYTFAQNVLHNQKWQGRCDPCFHKSGAPNKKNEDLKSEVSDTWTRFLKDGTVEIDYECGHKVPVSRRQTAVANYKKRPAYCPACHRDPKAAVENTRRLVYEENWQKNKSAEKKPHGGARNVKWTPDEENKYLTLYEDIWQKLKNRNSDLPQNILEKASQRGNSPSDTARDYAASLMKKKGGKYLTTVLARARKRRANETLHIQDRS